MLPDPINLAAWIREHRHLLKPPVGNKCLHHGEFIVMVVGGPNARSDYHVEEGPEWFHQFEGELHLRVQEDGQVREIVLHAGDTFLLPPRVPHSPQRLPGSVGLVIERRRLAGELDGLQWYCRQCNALLYEEFFPLQDIERDFPPVFARYHGALEHRTCRRCGHVDPLPATASAPET